jgi:hypothetical protein
LGSWRIHTHLRRDVMELWSIYLSAYNHVPFTVQGVDKFDLWHLVFVSFGYFAYRNM